METEMAAPIGFKEWAFVCEALGQGVQTIILRKGGIHEGRGGFQFEHDAFWLFPTGFHAQSEALKWMPSNAAEISVPQDEDPECVNIQYFARLQRVWRVTDWEKVAALEPFHVWKDELVRERFAWNEDSSLHVALVRMYHLPQAWSFPYVKGYGGCRSWVNLPEEGRELEKELKPVLDDVSWRTLSEKVEEKLSQDEQKLIE